MGRTPAGSPGSPPSFSTLTDWRSARRHDGIEPRRQRRIHLRRRIVSACMPGDAAKRRGRLRRRLRLSGFGCPSATSARPARSFPISRRRSELRRRLGRPDRNQAGERAASSLGGAMTRERAFVRDRGGLRRHQRGRAHPDSSPQRRRPPLLGRRLFLLPSQQRSRIR